MKGKNFLLLSKEEGLVNITSGGPFVEDNVEDCNEEIVNGDEKLKSLRKKWNYNISQRN